MENTIDQKQLIAIKAWEESRMAMGRGEIKIGEDHGFRSGYITGYIIVQQSQPMWREIEYGVKYQNVILKKGNETQVVLACYGQDVQVMGYTHYLSSDDLLKLPVEKK